MRRICALFLLLCLVIISCSANPKSAETSDINNKESNENLAQTDKYGRPIVESALPDNLNFGGETVSVLVRDDSGFLPASREFIAEQNGELINDSVYLRNVTVEEKLNIMFDLIITPAEPGGYNQKVIKSVMANDDAYDILPVYGYYAATLAVDRYLYNLLDLPYLTLSKQWWSQDFVNEVTLFDQLYLIVGDVCLSAIFSTHAMFFNKKLVSEYYGNLNLYDLVEKGQWTIDYFHNMIKDAYSDLNGDSARDNDDFYALGFALASIPVDSFIDSMGLSITQKGADGLPYMAYVSERSVSAYEKVYDLLYNNTGTLPGRYTTESLLLMERKFVQNEIIFLMDIFYTTEKMREMEEVYGVLPLFKYDEKQAGYYTNVADVYSIIGIPATCRNPEMIGAALEALSETSYMITTPAYFEVALKQKYMTDNIDAQMYDIILAGNKYNFGFVYSVSINGVMQMWRGLLDTKKTEFVSTYEASAAKYDEQLQSLIDKFAELKN
ncbi:MAG: hypothetical protein FWF15_05285 [Oscillospiraceae bacterium]|nr:hypothetical protein [Oscillospiraceae bacterium]